MPCVRSHYWIACSAAAVVIAGAGLVLVRPRSTTPVAAATVASASPSAVTESTWPRTARIGGLPLLVFALPLDRFALEVVDLPMSRDLEGTLRRQDAELAVNAGFFDEQDQPIGLVASQGRTLSPWRGTLGGGILTVSSGGVGALHAAEGFVAPPDLDLAIQCRPRLVVGGAVNLRSDDGRRAARTALCLRDGGSVMDVVVVQVAPQLGPTLMELARTLVERGCTEALNLDGGPSTGVAWRQGSEVHALPPLGPVRQALVAIRHERE
jgi:uncharacterized protein YigE (DUF2233 family)